MTFAAWVAHRRGLGLVALDAWRGGTERPPDESDFGDLLADVLLLAASRGVDIRAEVGTALDHALLELREVSVDRADRKRARKGRAAVRS